MKWCYRLITIVFFLSLPACPAWWHGPQWTWYCPQDPAECFWWEVSRGWCPPVQA